MITVIGASGGAGTSTIAANLAVSLAGKLGSCGLLDLSFESGDLATMLNLQPQFSVADFCDKIDRVDAAMFEQLFAVHESGVKLAGAPYSRDGIAAVTTRGIRQFMAMAKSGFPQVIVDVGRSIGEAQREAILQADLVLMVMRLDINSVRNARRLIDQLMEMGISGERLQIVANHFRQRGQLSVSQVERSLSIKISGYIPDDPGRINQSLNDGRPVVVHAARSGVAKRLAALATDVVERVGTLSQQKSRPG